MRRTIRNHTAHLLLVVGIIASLCVKSLTACGDNFGENGRFLKSTIRDGHERVRRSTIEDRKACQSGDEQPKTRVDTTERLKALREEMRTLRLDAFLVPSGDSHQSEYVAKADKRRQWIGGFSGSSGFAAITLEKAAMWADGRYFLQAEDQLDCNWLFMKGEEDDDLAWSEWLFQELKSGARIGADPSLTGAPIWEQWIKDLSRSDKGFNLVPLEKNPIDTVWEDQPPRSTTELEIHDLKYAGVTWQDKVEKVREKMSDMEIDAMVVTALDEVAWLLNLRGNDIPYTPVFRAYAVLDANKLILYLPPEKQTVTVKQHLKSEDCTGGSNCVEIRDYDAIFAELEGLSDDWNSVLLGRNWAYSGGASYAIYRLIPESKRRIELSPIMLMKAQKNEVEVQGMLNAHIRDSVALIEMADILEKGMERKEHWDELKVAKKLKALRRAQNLNKGLSFPSISAYGANGAVIHYKPNEVTNTKIGYDALFLLDSGGQYLDGTTDVTRTFHYGTPTDFEREVYTRVLMGSIDLARATFLDGTPDTRLDILARWNLYKVGLNYRHGTGHGIGAYGFIHESPIQVRVYASQEHPMREGYFFSDEPGYYEPGVGGVRLETVLRTVKKDKLPYSGKDYGNFLGFEPVCLMPFEPKLIDYSLLSDAQIDWLNNYNRKIREKIGSELNWQGKTSAYNWMMQRTEPIKAGKSRQGRSSATIVTPKAGIILAQLLTVYAVVFATSR